jgi:hypothetical protein
MSEYIDTKTDLKAVFAENLSDVNKDIIHEKYLATDLDYIWASPSSLTEKYAFKLDSYYITRLFNCTPPGTFPSTVKRPYLVDPNAYWTDDGYTIPSGYYNYLATYSRASLLYPFVGANTKLPDLTPYPTGTGIYIGFEQGGATFTGIACFLLTRTDTGIILYARYGSRSWLALMDVTSRLPADYTTAAHKYYVKVNSWGAEFFIDNRLVAVGLDIPEASQNNIATCPPYAIGVADAHTIKRLHTLVEMAFPYPNPANIRPNPGSLTLPLSPTYFRWGEDEPNPPRAMRLYQANSTSLMAGASISSGSLSSHPIPIYGRTGKTLYFQADQAGTLLLEILTLSGNWRTYDSVSVSAGTLVAYPMSGDAVLARVTFTPSAYPCTVAEAETALR